MTEKVICNCGCCEEPQWAIVTAEGLWGKYFTEEQAEEVHDRFEEGAAYIVAPDGKHFWAKGEPL